MRQKIILPTIAGLAALTVLAACGGNADSGGNAAAQNCTPAHQFSTIEKGALRVSSFDLPPYSKFEGSTLTGVDVDILNQIAKKECLTVKAQSLDAANVIPAVQNGRVDVAAGDWYRTAARAQIVDLSDPLYIDQMGIISKDGANSLPALKGQKIGTVEGYLWVADTQKYYGSDLTTYPTSTAMWQDLHNGRIQVGFDSYGASTYTNTKNNAGMKVEVAKPLADVAASKESAQATFPVSKKNPDLLKAINDDLAQMKQDGTIKKILTDNSLDASAADTGAPRLIS
jgi:polar amino acid transport system substrate-binding protein